MDDHLKGAIHRFLLKHLALGVPLYEIVRFLKRSRGPRPFLRRLKDLGFSPQTILDIGANRGEWSSEAASIFPGSKFVLIEPLAEYRRILERFIARRRGSLLIEALAFSGEGTISMTVHPDMVGSSSMMPGPGTSSIILETREVNTLSIDGLVSKGTIDIPDMIKLDVQGAEMRVLEGCAGCLGTTRVIVLETSFFRFYPEQPLFHEIILFLRKHRYVVYDIIGAARRPFDNALAQADICFVPEDDVFRRHATWS